VNTVTVQPGRPFRILVIYRDFPDEEYSIVQGEHHYYETTCTDCWEEVDLYHQELDFLGYFDHCWGIFINIIPDDDLPWDDYFSMWWDGGVDNPFTSARFTSLGENSSGNINQEPWYNSEGGYGEYLIDVHAYLEGITPTGETTFSEIKLEYGPR